MYPAVTFDSLDLSYGARNYANQKKMAYDH